LRGSEEWGGGGGRRGGGRGKIDGGCWERMSQVRKIGKMFLNGGFPFFVSLHGPNNRLENIYVLFYLGLSNSVGNQKPILR